MGNWAVGQSSEGGKMEDPRNPLFDSDVDGNSVKWMQDIERERIEDLEDNSDSDDLIDEVE